MAYDVFGQIEFEQEERVYQTVKLQLGPKATDEQLNHQFWTEINSKRFMQSLVNLMPFYMSWILSTILLINVSALFKTLIVSL